MTIQTRKRFISALALIFGGAVVKAMPSNKMTNKQLIHHVFFWLKNPGSQQDLAKLVEGLKTLEKIETVKKIHVGIPASTEKREVVDSSFAASEILFFDDVAGQKVYQDHPIHQAFIKNCSHLWEKVIVYDAIDV